MGRLVVLGVAMLLSAAACGGNDLSGDGEVLADAIVDQMLADLDPDDPFGEPEARCYAEGVVRDMGVGELARLGITA